MKVYIANFGRENYEWPECYKRGTVATMNEIGAQAYWEAGDREAYIQRRMLGRTAAGIIPTRPVASRWFNLMTIVSSTAGDIWIHRAKDDIWWTTSKDIPPTYEEKAEPIARGNQVVVCHKSCDPWSNRNRVGNRLDWNALHPRAKDFLVTESTLQALSKDYAEYALALIGGDDLAPWHVRPDWKKKTTAKLGKGGPGTVYSARQKAAWRMVDTAIKTAAQANGQQLLKTAKIKNINFSNNMEFEKYICDLLEMQEGICALTDLPYFLDGENDDRAMLCSLDRIDSSGDYEPGNLQIVCRFANEWKSSRDNIEFKRLIEVVRNSSAIGSLDL